jgi:putative ABC transport system permease protein
MYGDAGISINHVKSDSFKSAEALQIFPEMFMAFGFIIIIAGIIFVINIMVTMVYNRRRELGILRALGLRRRSVLSILTLEGIFYALPASIVGSILGIGVAFGLAFGLNNIWSNLVEQNQIPFYFTVESLFIAFISGFFIGIISISIAGYRMSKEPITKTLRSDTISGIDSAAIDIATGKVPISKWKIVWGVLFILIGLGLLFGLYFDEEVFPIEAVFIVQMTAPIMLIFGLFFCVNAILISKGGTRRVDLINKLNILFGIAIIAYILMFSYGAFRDPSVPGMEMFFIGGLSLLFGILLVVLGLIFYYSDYLSEGAYKESKSSAGDVKASSTSVLMIRNMTRNRFRSTSTIIMFSLIVFLIFALATNISLSQSGRARAQELAGGGYDLIGESTIPINFDLNNESSRVENGLDHEVFERVDITPLKSAGLEAGKCSNMNAIYPPRIFGVDDKFINENDFKFMRAKYDIETPNVIWEKLAPADSQSPNRDNNPIPIIGDYETLVWLYYGDIGSIFEINDDYGNVHKLEVIGIINSPIFAGSFILHEENFDLLFPISGQLKSFLIKTSDDPETVKHQIEWELRNVGMSVTTIEELTLESIQYVNSYMNLFQMYLYLGLIVGIAALGIMSLKATQERKYEIGVLKAIGFKNRNIFSTFILENTIICSIGIIIGASTGILMAFVSYPFWGLTELTFSLDNIIFLLVVIISIIIITILLTFYPAYRASRLNSAEALRHIE